MGTAHRKNWLSLVLGPALAMDSTPEGMGMGGLGEAERERLAQCVRKETGTALTTEQPPKGRARVVGNSDGRWCGTSVRH